MWLNKLYTLFNPFSHIYRDRSFYSFTSTIFWMRGSPTISSDAQISRANNLKNKYDNNKDIGGVTFTPHTSLNRHSVKIITLSIKKSPELLASSDCKNFRSRISDNLVIKLPIFLKVTWTISIRLRMMIIFVFCLIRQSRSYIMAWKNHFWYERESLYEQPIW